MARETFKERTRRQRSVLRTGLLLSLLLHVLAFVLFRQTPERLTPYAAAGPASGDPVAASGGGGMRAMVLKPPEEIVVPPRPDVPTIDPVEVDPVEEEPMLSLSDLDEQLGEGPREGPETGEGLPGGEGGGDAGNSRTGLRRLIPPTPRGVIMAPMDRPSNVKGKEVTVWVFVNRAGVVDSVRLEPPTGSTQYNERLIRNAYNWNFEPAERASQRVAAWWSYTWKL